jgi:hypothetical protein
MHAKKGIPQMKRPKLESVANVVMIVTGLAATGMIVERQFSKPAPPPPIPQPYSVGEKLNTGTLIDYSRSPRNLVVALSTKCSHCETVMPFLKGLATSPHDMKVTVVGREDIAVLTEYLSRHDVTGVDIVTMPPQALKVPGVPTILLVDREGRFVNSWSGRLSEVRQQALRAALGMKADGA